MSDQRCGLCRFWPLDPWAVERQQDNAAREFGASYMPELSDCRRRAPVRLSETGEQGAFPKVDRHSWCGEFERDEKRLPRQ
jgi:hypothetical protein